MPDPLSRRRLLTNVALAATGTILPVRAGAETASDGFRILRARSGIAGGDGRAPPLSFDAAAPGPALRCRRGEELRIRLTNELAEPVSLHWHGVRVPNAMDGVPGLTQPAVAPGASFDYRFRPPDAGTFWYHAFAPGQTERGLHGALIVEEIEPVIVDRDLVLLLTMPEAPRDTSPSVLVNGTARPDFPVTSNERLRLRLINATASRGVSVRIEGHIAWVLGIDGQPAEPFVARNSQVGLSPGGRIDLLIDAMRDAGTAANIVTGAGADGPIARLVYEGGGRARASSLSPPAPLPANPLPERIDLKNSLRLELALAGTKSFDPGAAPLFRMARGRSVTLALRNTSGRHQVVHIHGHSFRLLDRLDDGWKPYWLDTLVVGEQTERIAFVADNPGKWLVECRALDHPAIDTAVWFAVT